MGKEHPENLLVTGTGALAASSGIAAGQNGIAAGGDVKIANNFFVYKGPLPYRGMGDPAPSWDAVLDGVIEISKLREFLLKQPERYREIMKHPRLVSVKGLLYPSALLVSGWWESRMQNMEGMTWLNPLQEWLFTGFHSWGPSWDFTWDFEIPDNNLRKPSFIAQLGEGDEANSIPVAIPSGIAGKLVEKFLERGHKSHLGVNGALATVTGILCHRSHCPEAEKLGLVGGILDFCIWLKEGETNHEIKLVPLARGKPELYSGYLWKCLSPDVNGVREKTLGLDQVYFVWEHTNLADADSVKYNLDSLEHKESYVRNLHGGSDLVLLQKSSPLIPGLPQWGKEEFYSFFAGEEEIVSGSP